MTSEVMVSVVISTRNRARYLPDVLRSLADQECEVSYEVVVIDNGSTDDTMTVLAAWSNDDPRFRAAHEPRLGLSYGKNAGIRLARAPLLLFTDDDTMADPHWIQSYFDFFTRRGQELMVSGGRIVPIPDDLGAWPGWFDEPALADLAALDHCEERSLKSPEYVWGANMAVPKSLFDRFGLWDETVGRRGDERGTFEDTEFQDRIRHAGGAVWFCPAAVVRHRVPRHAITPRQISSTAFTRGRNHFWMQQIPVWHDVGLIPRRSAVKVLGLLAVSLCRWSLWLIVFRVLPSRRSFEGVRRAAFASGDILDSLRAGRGWSRLNVAVTHFVFRVRGLLLRLSPDAASTDVQPSRCSVSETANLI
jgi:glycosyltransferase involved in cell wall biosynthesis